jgi:hypothetical protein
VGRAQIWVNQDINSGSMIMRLSKTIVARVVASIVEGVSPEEFAQYAERNLPYRLSDNTCLYVVGRRDKKVPIKELTNLKYAPLLILALPYDSVTLRTLSVLWLLDIARGNNSFSMIDSYNINIHILIVADVGKDSFTHQTKYGMIRLPSAKDLFNDIEKQISLENKGHLKKLWASYQWDGAISAAAKLFNEYAKGALKARLIRNADTYFTLPE